jgi:tRNA G18 (ribose-2'-O)-methylase SpoU
MELTSIADPADPRVADYFELQDAALARSRGAFIAESPEVVRRMVLAGRFPIRSLFLEERRAAQLADVLARVPEGVPIHVAPQSVMDRVVGFHLHRGVLAAGARPEPADGLRLAAALGPGPRTVVVTEAIANHDNVGGIFRNAAAFGADLVLLDPRTADPLYRKSIRTSIGTALVVPFGTLSPWPEALGGLLRLGFTLLALTPGADARPLEALLASGGLPERVALLLGTEGVGLSTDALAAASLPVCIPMSAAVDSLNVATTAGIALFALRAARSAR